MKRAKKYNIVIYTSMLLAIVLLGFGAVDYLKDKQENNNTENEVETLEDNETIDRNDSNEKEEMPEELKDVDMESIIKKHLDSIADQIKKDKLITYSMINTWGDYSIGEIEFKRVITTKYYEYVVNILIPNKDAKIPGKKNEKLSTDEYTVISLYFDIVDSERSNGFIVKNIDLINK